MGALSSADDALVRSLRGLCVHPSLPLPRLLQPSGRKEASAVLPTLQTSRAWGPALPFPRIQGPHLPRGEEEAQADPRWRPPGSPEPAGPTNTSCAFKRINLKLSVLTTVK